MLIVVISCAALALFGAVLVLLSRVRDLRYQIRAVIDAVDDGIIVQDRNGDLRYVNEAASRMLGYDAKAKLLSSSLAERLAHFQMFAEDGSVIDANDMPSRRVLAGKEASERVVRFHMRSSGEDIWNVTHAHPVTRQDGRLLFAVSSFRNVTETRRLKEAERTAQEWFATALRSIGDAVIATDRAGSITFMNPVAEALTGWRMEEARTKALEQVFRIVSEETGAEVESPVAKVIAAGAVVGLSNHTLLIKKSGGTTPIDDSAAPIRDRDGTLVGVVLVFRDVSQKRLEDGRKGFISRATAELASSVDYETTLRALVQLAVPEIADWAAVDLLEGEELHRLASAHRDPEQQQLIDELRRRYPVEPDRDVIRQTQLTQTPQVILHLSREQIEASPKDAEHKAMLEKLDLCSFIAVPLSVSGRAVGVMSFGMACSQRLFQASDVGLATTLADRASIAIEHARLFREAERANRTKDEFLAILGHELRNPLAPILTALHLMDARDGPSRELTIIDRQLKHVVRLVDDLLDVSRIARGKIELTKEPLELAEVLANAAEMTELLFRSKGHLLEVNVPQDLRVEGDRVRLSQVFANLLTNAAKYTDPKGHIRVSAELRAQMIVVHIADSGIGMSAELLPRIFDMFTQNTQSIDRAQGGLGLGLTIVRSLVELHGGTVRASSEGAGKGSELQVTLPALESAVAVVPNEAATPAALARILVVDDNIDAAELLGEALQMSGYEVVIAHDGPSAIDLARRSLPRVGLLDIGLPSMDGYELARRLLAMAELEGIKLVALTGYGQASDRERSAQAGFSAHLVKPISLKDVKGMLEALLRAS